MKKANVHDIRLSTQKEEFDFSGLFTFEDCLFSEITFDKTQELLKEAEQKLNAISGRIELEISKQKKREFKRVM